MEIKLYKRNFDWLQGPQYVDQFNLKCLSSWLKPNSNGDLFYRNSWRICWNAPRPSEQQVHAKRLARNQPTFGNFWRKLISPTSSCADWAPKIIRAHLDSTMRAKERECCVLWTIFTFPSFVRSAYKMLCLLI